MNIFKIAPINDYLGLERRLIGITREEDIAALTGMQQNPNREVKNGEQLYKVSARLTEVGN